jgi:hypothetical protein
MKKKNEKKKNQRNHVGLRRRVDRRFAPSSTFVATTAATFISTDFLVVSLFLPAGTYNSSLPELSEIVKELLLCCRDAELDASELSKLTRQSRKCACAT